MRTVREIYEHYRLPPALRVHQLRVAAIGEIVRSSFESSLEGDDILRACLFHDMGNILKFDLDLFPGLWGPEPRSYWESVKKEYTDTYGRNEHDATDAIVREIGISETVRRYIRNIGFQNLKATRDSNSYEQKICEYADLRVGPFGVLPLDGRIEDIHERYAGRVHADVPEDVKEFNELAQAAHDVERQIFERTTIKPDGITDESVAPIIERLWEYRVA